MIAALAMLLLTGEITPVTGWRCPLAYPGRAPEYRWDISLPAGGGIKVTDEQGRSVQATLVSVDDAHVVFAPNSISWDAKRLVKGRPRPTRYVTGGTARLDRTSGHLDVDNSVADGDGKRLDAAAIDALEAAERTRPVNNPMLWMLLRIAATPQAGDCTPLP
jgi:hypothetical protein